MVLVWPQNKKVNSSDQQHNTYTLHQHVPWCLFGGQTSTMSHVGAMCTCYVVDHCCLAFYFVARQAPWHMLVQCVRVMLLITAVYLFIVWPDKHHGTCWCNVYAPTCAMVLVWPQNKKLNSSDQQHNTYTLHQHVPWCLSGHKIKS
jgi:hypothetical protein